MLELAVWKAWGVSITFLKWSYFKENVFCSWTQLDELLRPSSVLCFLWFYAIKYYDQTLFGMMQQKKERFNCRGYGKLSLWHLWLSLCWKIKLVFLQRNSKSWTHVHQIDKTLTFFWMYCYFWSLILPQT